MSGALPSYEVLSQRNVTMFTGCDFLCLYMYSKMTRLFFGNEMSSVVKVNSIFHDMINKDAQSDVCLCCSLTRKLK